MKFELFLRIVVLAQEAVGGIGEVEVAVRLVDGVVGAVEPLALVAIGEDLELAVGFEPGDATVAVLAEDEPSLGVHGQPVRARFAAAWV